MLEMIQEVQIELFFLQEGHNIFVLAQKFIRYCKWQLNWENHTASNYTMSVLHTVTVV